MAELEKSAAPPNMVVTTAYPPRSQVGHVAPFQEVGVTGLRQYGGFVVEEWLRQLSGPRAAWVWREMADNDATIGAILFAVEMLARGVDWHMEEGSDPKAAEFIEECREDMSSTWGDLISEILSCLVFGFSLHEIVYKRRKGPNVDPPSKYDDGKIGWRKLPIRAQETIWRWLFDEEGGIQAAEQISWDGVPRTIPMEKALLFRTKTTKNNPDGRPILRNAFVSWYAKKNIETIESIGIERDLAGIPTLTPPDEVDLSAKVNEALKREAETLVRSIKRDEFEGIVLPSSGWKFDLVSAAGSRQIDTNEVIKRYDLRIATSVLADMLLTGQDKVGSYAMVDVKADILGAAVDTWLDMIAAVFNRYAIPRLLKLNKIETDQPPELHHGTARRVDLDAVAQLLERLTLAGAVVFPDNDLLAELFTRAGLPTPKAVDLDEEPDPAKPEIPVPPKEPGEPQPTEVPPVEPKAPVTKAEAHSGVMVALYPDPKTARKLAQSGGEPPEQLHVTLGFLGKAGHLEDVARLKQVVKGFAASASPLKGEVSGTGKFTAGPEPVTYASVDLPGLPTLRERLIEALKAAGYPPSADHGFTAHMTLAYDDRDVDVKNHPLVFSDLTLTIAGKRFDYPLSGMSIAKADIPPLGRAYHKVADIASAVFARQISTLLAELGKEAASAYEDIAIYEARKAQEPTRDVKSLTAAILTRLDLAGWVRKLARAWHSHAARVLQGVLAAFGSGLKGEGRDPDIPLSPQTKVALTRSGAMRVAQLEIERKVAQSIETALTEAEVEGLDWRGTAERLRDRISTGPFVKAGKAYRAELIARTETTQAAGAAQIAAYEAHPGVTGVEILDGLKADSDDACKERSGRRVSYAEAAQELASPVTHPNCTITLLPVFAEEAAEVEPELVAG